MQVLYVEDNALNRRVVREMLNAAGVDVAEAEDGRSGIASLDDEDFDLVLMDMRMPGLSGLQTVRAIRARSDSKSGVPIVMITADVAEDLRSECLRAGVNDVLSKPLAANALYDALARVSIAESRTFV